MSIPERTRSQDWPELPFKAWSDTAATLHMWMQVIGKIRLVRTPWINHSWHVPFYVTARGLGTSLIPYDGRAFSVEFDLLDHRLVIQVTDGGRQTVALESRTVADFYRGVIAMLATLGIEIRIRTMPCEVPDAIPFEQDIAHQRYDPEFATRFWLALVQIDRVFKVFRARFSGKCSPVHFFWGSFDLAVTRFSGREAPPHPGGMPHVADWVAREAYSARVEQRRFLARRRFHRLPVLLFLCVSRAARFRGGAGRSGGGILIRRNSASSCFPTTTCVRRRRRTTRC